MNPSIDDFADQSRFTLLQKVSYSEMRTFVIQNLVPKSRLLVIFSAFQLISLIIPVLILIFDIISIVFHGAAFRVLLSPLLGLAFSFTFLVLIHELIHMLAFKSLGRKQLRIGANIRKFLFYVEANKQVLNQKEYLFIAILPFLFILCLGIISTIIYWNSPLRDFMLTVTSIHSLFCAGDIAIIAYMRRGKKARYTYDDARSKTTYFYEAR